MRDLVSSPKLCSLSQIDPTPTSQNNMPHALHRDRANGHAIEPASGLNYRRTMKKTSYFRRAISSSSVRHVRIAGHLVDLVLGWIAVGMQHLLACVKLLLLLEN